MELDLTAWLATQADLASTAPSTTIVPTGDDVQRALELLQQMAGQSLLASVQLKPGAVIAEGGMGLVREAEQVALGRTVAIKTLKPGKRNAEAARDLLREAWVGGSLEHPNVVPVHHLGVDEDGLPVLVLKRISGVEWSKLIADAAEVKRRFGATDVLAWNLGILMQVLNAIRFAHSRGILHRDLKPANVMVGDFGEVYLLDWGIAVSLRDDGTGRLPLASNVTQIAGTPFYMAPEMLQPDGDVPLSERTDVYLAGAVLFEIIAGRPPHSGKTALQVMTSVLSSKPELPADVPAELAAICMRAIDVDAGSRYDSADALRLALQRYLEHRGSDQILVRARARLDELAALLAITPADPARHREEVYRLLGECRFGFHEALAAWRDNIAARHGIERATIAVAEYELASGDAATAVTLLSELDEPPPLLAKARAAAAEHALRRAQLEQLDQAHNPEIAQGSRGSLAVAVGVAFTVASVLPWTRLVTHRGQLVGSLFVVCAILLWIWFARAELGKTLINRRLVALLVFCFSMQTLLVGGMWALGVPPIHVHVIMLLLYTVICGVAAIAVDRVLVPSALAFGLAFIVASMYPAYWMHVKGAGAFCFTLNVLVAWRLGIGRAKAS